jgi:hypothetical protein
MTILKTLINILNFENFIIVLQRRIPSGGGRPAY